MLYIMRHGKTDWNALYKLQGRTDIPLNDEGREMAREAAKLYRDTHFDICFCSPLVRARETAELLLAGREIPIEYDERIQEMSFGIYEGTRNCFEHPELPVYTLFKDPEHYIPGEKGESFEELFARTGAFLNEKVYPLLREGKDVLIIGHGAMNCSIVCQVKNLPLAQFWSEGIENCRLKQLC